MLVIRFFRVGKKNQPSFKIVATDKRRPPRGGRFTEEVGFWNPQTKEKVLKAERIKYWISKGAQPSDTVHNLLVNEKIIEGKKIPVHKIKKETVQPGGQLPTAVPQPVAPLQAAPVVTPETLVEKPIEEKEAPKQEKPAEKPVEAKEAPKEEKKEEKPIEQK